MTSKIEKAIKAYLEDNFKKHEIPRCITCNTIHDVGFDELSISYYCEPCLIEDLKNDVAALDDYYGDGE